MIFCFCNSAFAGSSLLPQTGQTISYRPGDDGYYESGVEWPNPRFTDNNDGTVTDHLTGLQWIKELHQLPGNSDSMLWEDAIDYCEILVYAGYSNWRVPNVNELRSLLHLGSTPYAWLNNANTPFSGINSGYYWTSTTRAATPTYAWFVAINNGEVSYLPKDDTRYVWPVRTGGL